MKIDYSNLSVIIDRIKPVLRDYQTAAVVRAAKTPGRGILIDMYMGLGKTLATLVTTFDRRPQKVVIIGGRNSFGAWIGDIRQWFPEFADKKYFQIIRAQGGTAKRAKLWKENKLFYICTLQTFVADMEAGRIPWTFDVLVYDEAHKLPKHTTKTYKGFKRSTANVKFMIFQSGTLFRRHAGSIFRFLHLIAPKRFSSYWKFIGRYCNQVEGFFGKQIIGSKNVEEFKQIVSPYLFRYHKRDGNVPASSRNIRWINLTAQQQKIYEDLANDMYTVLENGEIILSQLSTTTFVKHRQLMNCPKILNPSLGMGAAYKGLIGHLEEYPFEDHPEEHHFALFTPFRASIPYFKEDLIKRGYKCFEFVGGVDPVEVMERATAFRALKGRKSVALGTIPFGESYHLGTAIRSHFLGLGWDMDPMEQCEARLARADSDLSQTINHNYWLHNDTYEEDAIDMINGHVRNIRLLTAGIEELSDKLRVRVRQQMSDNKKK